MKNVFSIAILSLSVTSAAVPALCQKANETSKPAASQAALSGTESIAKSDLSSASSSESLTDSQKRYEAAMALSDAGRLDEAIEAFKQSLRLTPEDAQTHFGMGMTYSKSKAYKDALESFKKAVRYKPDWPDAHFRLGVMSYVLGKKSQSDEEYKKLVQMNSPLADVLYRIIQDDNASAGMPPNVAQGDPKAVAPNKSTVASAPVAANVKSPQPDTFSAVQPQPPSTSDHVSTTPVETATTNNSATSNPTDVYRVGIGDILDVRFLNSANAGRSTLFTVVAGGMIDFPVAGGAIQVAGLTTDEIQSRIATELKRRAIEDGAKISVGVRQYASHSVMITGLVGAPGARFLRREAVPLYVILAESQLRNDAARIVIMRSGSNGRTLDLTDPNTLNTPVVNGDVITVTGRLQEFYYIAGRVNYPGQKEFQSGITLLQAILAAGGTVRQNENTVEISREGAGQLLVTTRYSLKEIKAGGAKDPKLQPGDRIEVVR